MKGDAHEADYYRRRAASQATIADTAQDPKVRDVHRQLVALYEARAQEHAARAGGAPVGA